MSAARSRLEAPKLERYFTYRLNVLNKLNDMASQKLYLTGSVLSLAEARCLAAIGSLTVLTVNQLAYEAHLDKGQASRAAHALVERGLVKKMNCLLDRRSVKLSLTQEGDRLWLDHMQLVEQRNCQIVSCLTDSEKILMLSLMGRLIAHAQMGNMTN